MPPPIPTTHDPIDTAIIIVGAQRSGTTWLGKIFDSHPDVLYLHEPDEAHPLPPNAAPEAIRAGVAAWAAERGARAAGKRPFFRKSWQPARLHWLRNAIAAGLAAASRLPVIGRVAAGVPLPDFVQAAGRPRLRFVLKSVALCHSVGDLARALPDSRVVVILRHPCGQVHSVMRGNAHRRFDLRAAGTDMPYDEVMALRAAAERGIDDAGFQALADAAKYAWGWVAFNEAALASARALPNVRTILYEDLCAAPQAQARALFAFADLGWAAQTGDFQARSSSGGDADSYYAVFRDSADAAERWRTRMPAADQQAVRAVVRLSWLASLWPDLAAP